MDRTGELPLVDYWRILLRRRWVVYLALAAVGLVGLLGSFLATPLYRATATLQIDRQNPDILTFRDLAKVDYAFAAYADFYQTQYKLIASAPVARKAVEMIGLASHSDFAVTEGRPGLFARLRSLLPRKGRTTEQDPIEVAAARLRAALEISPVRNSQLVRVSWVGRDPELAARVANAVADAYIHFNIDSEYSTSDQARDFLVNQIGALKREILAIEERLQEYGEAKRIVSIDGASNLTLQALQDISQRRTEAQTALAIAEAAHRSVAGAVPDALPEVLHSDLIARLRQEHAAYEADYSEKARLFKEDWPGLQTLRSKIEQARTRLELETERIASQVKATAEATYRRALNEVHNLDELLEDHEQAAQLLKRDAVEYTNLQSEVQKKRETLDALLARQNEMALSTRLKNLDSTSSNIRVVERARPPTVLFRPRIQLNLLISIVLGLTLGVALAFTLDYLDNTIASVRDLERIAPLPVLAIIPRHGAGPASLARVRRRPDASADGSVDLIAHREGRARVTEAYRDLRTSILLSNPGRPPRLIMVTSALPQEGKTATALNLAVVLTQLGRRVVLVDTDLRRPRLHHAFGVDVARGVSTYLSGLERDVAPLVRRTDIDKLDLLASGPIPPNPAELLNSEIFSRMGQELIERGYDHVIFDSPPVISVSDPVLIATVVDAGLLVVRAGRTPRQSVRLAADRLRQAAGGPFGFVLNDLDPRVAGASYQTYAYYGGHAADDETPPEDAARQRASGRGA